MKKYFLCKLGRVYFVFVSQEFSGGSFQGRDIVPGPQRCRLDGICRTSVFAMG